MLEGLIDTPGSSSRKNEIIVRLQRLDRQPSNLVVKGAHARAASVNAE